MPLKIEKNGHIKNAVVQASKDGLSLKEAYALVSTRDYQNLPSSLTTFRKLYYDDFLSARADISSKIGNKMINKALEGDFKAGEFYLSTHSQDWQKKSSLEVASVDDIDEENTELYAILGALGFDSEDEEDGGEGED